MKEKLKGLFLLFVLAMFLWAIPNSAIAKAENITKDLTPNITITEIVDKGDSIWYKVTMTENGYFTISLKPTNIADSTKAKWSLDLYDKDANEITYWHGYSSVDSCKISATKGDVYYIVVSLYNNKVVNYDLRVDNIADSSWEKENNNSQDTATTLKSDESTKGMIMGDKDVDWYQYTMPSTNGYVQFVLDKDVTVKETWGMKIFDENGYQIKDYRGEKITSQPLPYKKGTKLYIKVYAYYNGARWQEYSITPTFVKNSNWEIEENNSEKSATLLNTGAKAIYKGLIQSEVDGQDVDYYKFKVTGEKTGDTKNFKKVNISFGPEQISATGTWRVDLINSSGESVRIFETDTKSSYQCYLKKGTYYLKVTAYYNSARDNTYTINVKTAKVAKPVIELKSYKIAKNSSWNGLQGTCYLSKLTKGLTNFKFYYSDSSKMKNCSVADEKSTTKTINYRHSFYFKESGTKYLQVSAVINDPFNKVVYEAKTKVKKISIPKVTF